MSKLYFILGKRGGGKENYKFLKMLAIFQMVVLKFILIIVLVSVPSRGKRGKIIHCSIMQLWIKQLMVNLCILLVYLNSFISTNGFMSQ